MENTDEEKGKNVGTRPYAGRMAMHNDPKRRQEKYKREREREMNTESAAAFKSQGRLSALQGGETPDGAGTSIFDPVLCEIAYRWFSPPGGFVLDPFAGGSVRGVVAQKLGRKYTGIELRPEQVKANREQAAVICAGDEPKWICGDSDVEVPLLLENYDFVFSCPPYGDLEQYSEAPDDISNMQYPEFHTAYRRIIASSVAKLKNDRFACFVVGDFRDKAGFYRNFVSHTIEAFEVVGAKLYNEAILVTALGSLPIRAARPFNASRKLGKTHQNVLIFCKGDPVVATQCVGAVDVTEALSLRTPEALAEEPNF